MHPGFFGHYTRKKREAWREARAQCGGHGGHGRRGHYHDDDGFEASGHRHGRGGMLFGVRRPLRFMAHKLDLDEDQVKTLAHILDDLKTERAQASVDDRRSLGALAESLEGEAFGEEAAQRGLDLRVRTAERLKTAVHDALSRTHAMLRPDQRSKLAYLLRSGVLST